MLYHFLFEIQHDCHFSRFSRNHPEVKIQLWCNNSEHDILELRGESTALKTAISKIEHELGTVMSVFPERGHVQLVIKRCECDKLLLNSVFKRHDCVELPPVNFFGGREFQNLLVTSEGVGLILEDIRKEDPVARVSVLKLSPLKNMYNPYPLFLPLSELKESFSKKQLQALKNAYREGYYELPRAVLVENLAKEMNIHRRTFEEHLRKAEKKIMSFLIPSLIL
ncbi:MAG: helix-turn-helix domain-containing protein [Candidatus Hermodarchaeota archaeon]